MDDAIANILLLDLQNYLPEYQKDKKNWCFFGVTFSGFEVFINCHPRIETWFKPNELPNLYVGWYTLNL